MMFAIRTRPSLLFLLILVIFACLAGTTPGQDLSNLSGKIQTGTTEEKRDALYQIRIIQTEAASRIAIPALSDPDPIVRATAAAAIAFLPESEIAVLLRALLGDKDEFVRREAAYALRHDRTGANTSALVKLMLEDKVMEVRTAAAIALGSGDVFAVEWLAKILTKKPKEDDEFLRRSAARSIGQIAEIGRSGRRTTSTPQNFLPEKYKDSITSSAATVSPHWFGNAVKVLLKVASNRKEAADTRREAAYALGSIGDESATVFLKANLNSKDNYLGEICKEALLKMPKPQ